MARIICTGVEGTLLQTRKLILEQAGHVVATAQDEADLMAACHEQDFDVAVIAQTMLPDLKGSLALAVRRLCPRAKILEIYAMHEGKAVDDADCWLEVPLHVPQELAQKVAELVRDGRCGEGD